MKHKQIMAIILGLSLAVTAMGCGTTNKSETEITADNNEANGNEEDSQSSEDSLLGTVRSVDVQNNQITVASAMGSGGGMFPGGTDNGNPPEIPEDGEKPADLELPESGDKPEGMEMPEGMEPGGDGNVPEMPADSETTYTVSDQATIEDKDGNSITLADLKENDFIEYVLDGDEIISIKITEGMDFKNGVGEGGPGGNAQAPTEYSSVTHYTEDETIEAEEQESTGTDENIAWVSDGANVTMTNITASKDSDDSTGGDQSSFYGVGAAYLVTDGTLTISDSTISTDSAGGAGVFAYGDGVAYVSDTTIVTKQGTSGGIHVAGGGELHASNLTVETDGESSAAIRSDRGSGVMTVEGGSYTSNGIGSPAVYSTADITVSDATLTATNSEAVCIEGKNSLKLENCDVSSNMPDNSQNDCKWSVILYQSMSGDSEIGESNFEMTGGSLSSSAGGLFYTTNTQSKFTLDSVDISTASTPDFFLKCTGNSNTRGWGQKGSNGATCTFSANNQQMVGDIIWDSISKLDLSITGNSVFTGAIIDDESNAGDGGDGYANVTLGNGSKWIVTGDSVLSSLTNDGEIVDENGLSVTITGADGTVYVEGESTYTITVQSYN